MADSAVAEPLVSAESNASQRPVWILLGVHAALLLALTCATQGVRYFTILAVVLVIYQLLLISLWAGLSSLTLGHRVLVFFLGTVGVTGLLILGMSIANGTPRDPDFSFGEIIVGISIATFTVSGLCSACLQLARWHFKLQRQRNPILLDQSYRSRMTVRHLLLVTFLCSVVIAGSKVPHNQVPILLLAAIFLAPLAGATFALVWAVLSPRTPWLRLILAFSANVGAAALMVVQFDYHVESMLLMLPGLIVFVATLLALRGFGYRLVRATPI